MITINYLTLRAVRDANDLDISDEEIDRRLAAGPPTTGRDAKALIWGYFPELRPNTLVLPS